MSVKYPLEDVHTLSVDETIRAFQTDAAKGLNAAEAANRTASFGANVYQLQKEKGIWQMLLQQFTSPIVYLLLFGAAVSFFFQDYIEAIAILAVIFINALIGFLMELQARNSMKALREMDVILSKVIRDGKVQEVPSEKVTPGDVAVVEAGDVIPADGRLISTTHLQCDESSLTGESLPTEKNPQALSKDIALGDRHNMVFKGASVINGNGTFIVTGIAQHTQLGTITSLVESSSQAATPLDRKLNALSGKLIWVTLFMTSIFVVTAIVQGKKWILILETSIALAVAAIPEGLPIVATVALAYGVVLMARRNAIVKKLASVETLGSTSVILTDKTGTLTENKIYVETFSFPDEKVSVKIENNVLRFEDKEIEQSVENFEQLKRIGTLCNNASLPADRDKKATGDPIEIALLQLASAAGVDIEKLRKEYERLDEVPFNSDTKIMVTLHKGQGGNFVAAKGSVEDLLEKCNKIQSGAIITDWREADKNTVLSQSEAMAAEGIRVLAFAFREGNFTSDNYATELVYVGMIGFLDPPRSDVKEAILTCRKAGIRIVMITGDHPMTALNIARRTGLVEDNEQKVITGKDLPTAGDLSEEWKTKILSTAVFARTTPKQKLDIADIYQKAGNIVAMTGDGVNDAPALKKADVGIAMGMRGTAVAKETASIVLKDDSFNSIAEAVAHGREIFQNIQKFVVYLVSCNLSEILIVTVIGFFAPASTLLPLQILFLNMITDVFPALALGLGKGDATIMDQPPRDSKEDIVNRRDWFTIVVYSTTMTLSVIAAVMYCQYYIHDDDRIVNNVAFITLVFAQLFHVFNMASPKSGLLINEITRNKFVWMALSLCIGLLALVFLIPSMRLVLGLVILSPDVWIVSLVAGLLPLFIVQAYKGVSKLRAVPA